MTGADGLNYIAIAQLYADAQWEAAVNAYWSPALSLLMAPFVVVGIDGITGKAGPANTSPGRASPGNAGSANDISNT